ncbi:MAG: DegT/DnrJ/EryC1/StrS family aminotransferase [Sedimentisphaerales bacterium]|jgi:dTDP-4-amino-4,6-dideoxygalactose transaminase
MQVPILDLKAQYAKYKSEVMRAIEEVCDSQVLCLGPAVEKFEKEAGAYCGCKYATGVSSGTDALLLGLMAAGIGAGDEVITTPFTFFATAGVVSRLGAKPVFVDVNPETYNIDPAQIEKKITSRTRAIIPVHLFGQMAQMKPIMEIAKRHKLVVIEDAAQAMGATQDGRKAGSIGDIGCFSFYPTKNIGAFGDAGMVVTNDAVLAERIRLLRVHGENPRYFYRMIGGNFRMDNMQGAVLSVKLKFLDEWNKKRRENAAIYDRIFSGTVVKTPRIERNNVSIYHQYTILAPERDELQGYLVKQGVGAGIFYPKPLHLQDCFKGLGYKKGDFPAAEELAEKVLSLPIYPEVELGQIEYVAKTVLKFYE